MEFSPCTKRNENLCDRGASGTRVGDSVEGGLKRKGVIYWEREKETLDDMLLASQSMTKIAKVKRLLNLEFEMKDLGHAKKILGIEITWNRKEKCCAYLW